MRGNKSDVRVHVQARIPPDIYATISKMATTDRPLCSVLCDAITEAVRGNLILISQKTVQIIEEAAVLANYESADSLVSDLVKAYIKTLRYHKGLMSDNETSPDAEIIEMFSDCNNIGKYEKSISVKKRK